MIYLKLPYEIVIAEVFMLVILLSKLFPLPASSVAFTAINAADGNFNGKVAVLVEDFPHCI